MAINLNLAKYGDQFNAFATFAAEHKNQAWVVRLDGRNSGQGLLNPNGEPRHIVAKDWDGAGNVLRFGSSKSVNNDVRALFKETILAVCGVGTLEELPPSVRAVMKEGDYDGKGRPLTVRRIKAVTEAIKAAAAAADSLFSATFATGSSPAVDKIRELVMSAPCVSTAGTQDEKSRAFTTKLSENTAKQISAKATNLIYKQFVHDGKADFTTKHEQFAKDLNRDLNVYVEKRTKKDGIVEDGIVKDEIVEDEISRNFETARDEIVRVITGNRGDTFENATDSVKRQTGVLMSIINQYTSTAVINAFQDALEKPNFLLMVSHDDNCKADTPMNFTLTRTTTGDIHITFGQVVGTNVVSVTEETGVSQYWTNTNSSCSNIGVEITLSAGSLKDVAEADWAQANLAAFEAEGDVNKQADLIPPELRLDMKVSATAHFVLDYAPPPEGYNV